MLSMLLLCSNPSELGESSSEVMEILSEALSSIGWPFLSHMMVGRGTPAAEHSNVTFSFSVTTIGPPSDVSLGSAITRDETQCLQHSHVSQHLLTSDGQPHSLLYCSNPIVHFNSVPACIGHHDIEKGHREAIGWELHPLMRGEQLSGEWSGRRVKKPCDVLRKNARCCTNNSKPECDILCVSSVTLQHKQYWVVS